LGDFRNLTKYIVHENPFREIRVVLCGRKDRQTDREADRQTHDEANSFLGTNLKINI